MWYAVLIESRHTGRRYIRISEDWVSDWIEILQIFHSDRTLASLDAAGDNRLGIIADMRENETILGYDLKLIQESEEPFTFAQTTMLNRFATEGIILPSTSGRAGNNQWVGRFSVDDELIHTYPSVNDAVSATSIPRKSIYKAIENNSICHNYKWHWIGGEF